MGWVIWSREEVAAYMDEAIKEADRTLSRRNRGGGYARVVGLVVEEFRYDEDKDDLVATGQMAIRNADGTWG